MKEENTGEKKKKLKKGKDKNENSIRNEERKIRWKKNRHLFFFWDRENFFLNFKECWERKTDHPDRPSAQNNEN